MSSSKSAANRMMSLFTARSSIDRFATLCEKDGIDAPQLVFYGGEPLINWQVIKKAVVYAKELMPNCGITINTNGTLLTADIAKFFVKYDVGVALSCDGRNNDLARVKIGGQGTLSEVLMALDLLQKHKVSYAISCTVTKSNIHSLEEEFLWFVDSLGVAAVDFNIQIGSGEVDEGYADLAARKLLQCFVLGRERGILIERVNRRVTSFSEGILNLVDCGGCGQQLVIAPDGATGCCHAFLNDRAFFFDEQITEPNKHPLWLEWKQRSPFNIPECLNCEALGICGGGCFYSAYQRAGSVMALDEVHCTHSKETLAFLVRDLWTNLS